MNNLDKFMAQEGQNLLSDKDLVFIGGGLSDNTSDSASDVNAIAHCGDNNCQGGNCASGCNNHNNQQTS